jgi:hypothetical protein
MNLRRRKPAPAPVVLDGSTMVVCLESFRRQPVARITERGSWLRFENPVVQEHPERFAVRLSDLEQHEEGKAPAA